MTNLKISPRKNIQKENQSLISLAVKCNFISARQEQEILSLLIEIYQRDPDFHVVSIFRERKILTQEKVDFLVSLRSHLKTKMLDKKFGEIGVSNRFVTPKNVEEALFFQDNYFRKKQKSKKIGDILVEKKQISPSNKTAILLTQDRIQDHLLEQAIYDIASSEMEKMTINKRFGAIAVKYGFITIEQLNQALKYQKKEQASGKTKQYLGSILKDLFQLKNEDILYILKIQQQIEKERLSLGKAVMRYQSEISSCRRLNELFDFTIAKDKMEVILHRKKESFEEITLNHFHNWLKLNGIRAGLISDELINSFLTESAPGERLKIARGAPCTLPVDETVQFYFDVGVPQDNTEIPENLVQKGQVLAKITPHENGKPGLNVLGHTILPPDPRMHHLMAGFGVEKKGLAFIACQDGIPLLYKQRTLFVEPYVKNRKTEILTGHIQTDTGETYQEVNLKIEGNIETAGTVSCHNLSILGSILGRADASGDIEIKGETGENESFARTSDYRTVVIARGSVKVTKNITQAKVVASKDILAPQSSVFFSELHARETIVLKNVHSSLEQPSVLQIGSIPSLKVEEINRLIDEQTAVLRTLQKQDEFDTLALALKNKRKIQNDYLEKQNILNHLIKICDADALKHISSLEQKIQVYEPQKNTGVSTKSPLPFSNDKDSLDYMEEVLQQIKGLHLDQQKQHLIQCLTDVSHCYRTAAGETHRYTVENNVRQKLLMKKIARKQPEIDNQKKKIEALMIEKDFLLLQEKPLVFSVKPMIRVRNMVEKNTLVKGKHTSMVIKDSIYGVRIREVKNMKTDSFEIVIDGYYD